MDAEWDPAKASSNWRKHRVRFSEAAMVFEDPSLLRIVDPDPDEDRFVGIGRDDLARLLVVVFTHRGDTVRIISARRATRREVRQYEEKP